MCTDCPLLNHAVIFGYFLREKSYHQGRKFVVREPAQVKIVTASDDMTMWIRLTVISKEITHTQGMSKNHPFFFQPFNKLWLSPVEMWWHTVTYGRGSDGGNWRMQWVASTLHTTSEHGVSSITTADAHKPRLRSSRLNWRPPTGPI